MTDSDSIQHTFACRKETLALPIVKMLRARAKYHLEEGDLIRFRLWTAAVPKLTQGLHMHEAPEPPGTVGSFLAAFHFTSPTEDEDRGSGLSPLIIACFTGNVTVVKDLLTSHNANVHSRVRLATLNDVVEVGQQALSVAAAGCPESTVRSCISALLAAGADPNDANKNGSNALLSAAFLNNSAGTSAFLPFFAIRLTWFLTRPPHFTTRRSIAD